MVKTCYLGTREESFQARGVLEMPNLIEVQKNPSVISLNTVSKRFSRLFPNDHYSGNLVIDFIGYS